MNRGVTVSIIVRRMRSGALRLCIGEWIRRRGGVGAIAAITALWTLCWPQAVKAQMDQAEARNVACCPIDFEVQVFYTGPECCYQFVLSQKWGAPFYNFTEVVATIETTGAVVSSASSDDGAPPPLYEAGDTMVRFFTRGDTGLFEDPHVVSICIDPGNAVGPISVKFQAYNEFGDTCGDRRCTELVWLDDSSCTGDPQCVVLLPNTFTPDRFGNLPIDRMQVVAMYDGTGEATLEIDLWNPDTRECCWLEISPINNTDIVAQEYSMVGFEPTGRFRIGGAAPDGVIDGVAFGLYVHDASGDRWYFRSAGLGQGIAIPNFVGDWPIAWSEATWDAKLPVWMAGGDFDHFVARRQAQVALSGAQLLSNGEWGMPSGRLTGDANGDGCVNDIDFLLVNSGYGSGCCD